MSSRKFKMDFLLDSKYDITLEEYWNLSEQDKNELAQLIVQEIHKGFKNLHNLPYHLSELDYRRLEAEEDQEFERADVIKRIIKKTIEFYG